MRNCYFLVFMMSTLIMLLCLVMVHSASLRENLGTTTKRPLPPIKYVRPVAPESYKKWIVITSVNYPTEDVKRLASLKGWKVVVVGDSKTPADWKLEGVHFLSVDDQKSLSMSLPKQLPLKTYTRKNVGYLYAIQKGAEWIYDTDDDNKPYGLGLKQFDYGKTSDGVRFSATGENIGERLFNPYRYFGNKNMWPRGFPLEHLNNHTNGEDRMKVCSDMRVAAVQQGIVHKDPDVDAIYRLLKASPTDGLNENFNRVSPPITMDKNTYAPWNSQNTLFHRRAFFTLFLPTTVAFRVTDIWRSYFSQKLLHLIGENVAFYPVNAIQIRNAHNYLSDFKEELDVYLKSGEMIEFLDEWKCDNTTVRECTMSLASEFRIRGFIGEQDEHFIETWLEDLQQIGYEFPPLAVGKETEALENCVPANLEIKNDLPVEKTEPVHSRAVAKINGLEEIMNWCKSSDSEKQGDNSTHISKKSFPSPNTLATNHAISTGISANLGKVLVLTTGKPETSYIGLLQRLYTPYFGAVVFCGPWNPATKKENKRALEQMTPFNFIHVSEPNEKNCLESVQKMRLQKIDDYLIVSDRQILNIWNTKKEEDTKQIDTMSAKTAKTWQLGTNEELVQLDSDPEKRKRFCDTVVDEYYRQLF